MGEDDFSKIPNGHPAIEHRMELLYSEGVHQGKISLTKYVEIASTNAAKIFGMYPRKGTIAIGSDADIVIFDPNKEHTISVDTHHMNCDIRPTKVKTWLENGNRHSPGSGGHRKRGMQTQCRLRTVYSSGKNIEDNLN